MQQKFNNKTVLITGGSRGQGAAEARMFAAAGARVVIADVLDAEGGALAQAIRAAGGSADYRHLDVTSEQDWRDAVAFAKSTFGALHVLVNNAGVSLRGVDLANTTRADWDRVLAVNLTGPFLGIRAAAPLCATAAAAQSSISDRPPASTGISRPPTARRNGACAG